MQPYDPKLKEAAAEIKAILKKHDIGGYVTLMSETHAEFVMEITPTWSCAYWEDRDEGMLRFKAKTKELGKEKAQKLVEGTCHMIFQMRDLCAQGFSHAEKMCGLLSTQVDIEHKPFSNFTPHREQ